MKLHAHSLRRLLQAGLFSLLLSGLGNAQGNDADVVRDFKKYFKKFKDTPSRVEAVLSLKGTESVEVVEALLPILNDPEASVAHAAVQVLGSFTEAEPIAALGVALEQTSTPQQKAGLLQAVRDARYKLPHKQMHAALLDKDWGVRRFAVQALCASYPLEADGTPEKLAPLCRDPEPALRCQAMESLTALKSPLVVAPAILNLSDPFWQVRSSAIGALRAIRHNDSVQPLVDRMQIEEGRLVPEIADALVNLTGRKFGLEPKAWKEFLDSAKGSYRIPTEEGLKYFLAQRDAATGDNKIKSEKPPAAVFHGIETQSRSIIFVIDQSGSMEAQVVEKERFKDGNYPSMMRIDICKTELQRTIERLDANVNFNILAFATGLSQWKKGLVSANLINKTAAIEWVGRLEPLGGNSKSELAEAGLGEAAGLGTGKTNTYGSLMWALSALGPRTKDPFAKNYQVAADTIFFLSDGRPTVGDYIETDDILREVKAANELRKMVIHTIAIGEFEKAFMRRLAEDSKGVFVDLGH